MKRSAFYLFCVILFSFFSCYSNKRKNNNNSQLPDSTLFAIRDGFDTRVAEYFEVQKDTPLAKWKSSGWNEHNTILIPKLSMQFEYNTFKNDNLFKLIHK